MIQMDQASAHRAQEVDWSENIISLFQSAYIPKLIQLSVSGNISRRLFRGTSSRI